jgi:hypothetical protein
MRKSIVCLQIAIVASVVYSHDYFPIAVGNEWNYRSRADNTTMKWKIESDTVVAGKHIYKFTQRLIFLPSAGRDWTFDTTYENYLFSNNNDIFINKGPCPDGWEMYYFKHSYFNGETWVGNIYYDTSETLKVKYEGIIGLFDSCYFISRLNYEASSFVFVAIDVGTIIFGVFNLVDFHLQNTSVVRRNDFRFMPTAGTSISLINNIAPRLFTLNGRVLNSNAFSIINHGAAGASNVYIMNYPDGRGSGNKTSAKNIMLRK